ncbi:MAG: PilZ domain-containing protein [Acidobacteriota bacterium]
MPIPLNTRRWPRYQVVLPVHIVALNRRLTPPTLARGSAISRAGMALHARVALSAGDLIQLQIPTSPLIEITAVVRNRTGDCSGLEFLPQLPLYKEAREQAKLLRSSVPDGSPELRQSVRASCNPQTVFAALQRKRQEQRHVQREIEALNMAILLLADDEHELSRAVNRVAASHLNKTVEEICAERVKSLQIGAIRGAGTHCT